MIRAVLLVALLAGCMEATTDASAPAALDSAPPTADPPDWGGLDVYALDPALHPIQGVVVSLDDGQNRTTDGDGLASFERVAAGAVSIKGEREGYRTASGSATVHAGERTQADLKLLEGEQREPIATNGSDASYREQFHFRGFFECSATYLIITGDCMLIVDTVTGSAGLGTPAGDATEEEYMLDFPLDHGWTSVVGEMHWEANGPANGEQMTFALEPTEYDSAGHAPKYARDEGASPLRWVVHAGEPHLSATASADGEEPDMPNRAGGEVVRTRSYVAGQFLHRPAGTAFLGVGAAASQEFEVVVTVFYGERAPEDFTIGSG